MGLIPGLVQWAKDLALCSYELRCRSQMQLGSDVAVAVGWPAAAALIGPLAWEPHMLQMQSFKKKKSFSALLPDYCFFIRRTGSGNMNIFLRNPRKF